MAFSEDGSEVLVLLGRSRPAINSFGTLAWWPALGGKPRPFLENVGLGRLGEEGTLSSPSSRTKARRASSRFGIPRASSGGLSSAPPARSSYVSHLARRDRGGVHPSPVPDRRRGRGPDRLGGRDKAAGADSGLRALRRAALEPAHAARSGSRRAGRTSTARLSGESIASGRLRMVHSFPDFFHAAGHPERREPLSSASSEDTSAPPEAGDDAPTDFSWLGSTFVADISPGRAIDPVSSTVAPSAGTLGAWVRSARRQRGDPDRGRRPRQVLARRAMGRGHEPPLSGPPQLILVRLPAEASARAHELRRRRRYSSPSFLGTR